MFNSINMANRSPFRCPKILFGPFRWEQDNSSTRQLIDTVYGDNSSTQLKTTHRHFLKTINRHIIILQLFLFKISIMGTRLDRLIEAIRTSTHNLCFRVEIRKFRIPLQTPVLLYNSVVRGGKKIQRRVFLMAAAALSEIRQQPHNKCCKFKTFPHSEHNN